MKLIVLASGSKANCAILDCGSSRLMIDCGMSAARIEDKLRMIKLDPGTIQGIMLTHEHGDHTKGLANFVKKWRTQIYCNAETMVSISGHEAMRGWNLFSDENRRFGVAGIPVTAFPVEHDAAKPVGFEFLDPDINRVSLFKPGQPERMRAFAFVTDIGSIDCIQGIDPTTLFIEANYDDNMLDADRTRPDMVKNRIRGSNGHLSNADAAIAASGLPGLRKIILGHLSEATNCPKRAAQCVKDYTGVETEVAWTPECNRHLPPIEFDIL